MTDGLVFGVFPLGVAGSPSGVATGPPDDFDAVERAVVELQGAGPPLLGRMYVSWGGRPTTAAVLGQVAQLAAAGVPWDMVLCYRDQGGDVGGWQEFVAEVVRANGHQLSAIQVTGEANLPGIPGAADGAYPRVREALVAGVIGAAIAKHQSAATADIGFAVVPEVDPAQRNFWREVHALGGTDFADAVDYAGIDLYPDVFGPPIGVDRLPGAVDWLLRTFRERDLAGVGIAQSVPIRVCENGWPTGPNRSEERQAEVLETVIRSVAERRRELNVTHWELFTLRDADSSNDDMFHQFGILRDDYSPKLAFETVRRLIAELGRS